jgi:hypothetical protein
MRACEIEPHEARGKSLRCSIQIKPIKTPIAIEAKAVETIKHIIIEPTAPIKAVCQEKYLNVGRKFGADAKSSAKHDKLTAK